MQSSSSLILILTSLSFCGDTSPSSDTTSPYEFSCDDYQLMLEVELFVGQECSEDEQCQQIILEGDLECEANSIVGNINFDSVHFYNLYDEALAAGCSSIDLQINQDCSATETVCRNATCEWQ